MTIEANWEKLVWAEKPNGELLLSGLREKCPCITCHIRGEHSDLNCQCDGTGWVAKPVDMPLLLSEMRKAGFRWLATETGWGFLFGSEDYHLPELKTRPVRVVDSNDQAACVEAAWKAVEGRDGKAN